MTSIQIQAEHLTPGDVLDDGRKVLDAPRVRGSFVVVVTNDALRPVYAGRSELVTLREMVTD